MIKIDHLQNNKIHNRQIDITIYENDASSFVMEGKLTDTRFRKTFYMNGATRPPGTLHGLVIRMQISRTGLMIEDIEVDMNTVPRAECREISHCLECIKGMKISSGFSEKVKTMVGGAKGCAHLVTLLLAMGPAAVQGAWSIATQNPANPADYSKNTLSYLENTCWVWRSDGLLMKEYLEKMG
jgi:hypothetical protein